MPGISGIIYPNNYPTNKWIHNALEHLHKHDNEVQEIFIYKNFSLGANCKEGCIATKKFIWIALDGHIYNLDEIKQELKTHGRSIETLNPVDTLHHAYETWGIDFVKKLNGSFALVIFDKRLNDLYIFRDPLGIKTLYWIHYQQYIVFSTEIKAIICLDFIPQIPYLEGLGAFLYMGFMPQDLSPIANLNKLLPSSYLHITTQGTLALKSYWSFCDHALAKKIVTEEQLENELDAHLKRAIAIQTASLTTEKVTCFMLGGLGSAATAHYLVEHLGKDRVEGYAVAYKGENERDLEGAQSAADSLGIKLHTYVLSVEDLIDQLPLLQWYMDEPTSDPHLILTWYLTKQAQPHTQHIFSGMGCDELLAANLRYSTNLYYQPIFQWLFHLAQPLFVSAGMPILRKFNLRSAIKMLRKIHYDPWVLEYLKHHSLFSFQQLKKLSPTLAKNFNPILFLQKFYSYLKEESDTASFLYFDTQTTLTDSYIQQFNKTMAYFDMHWHSPFLEQDTLRYLIQIPENLKIRNKNTAIPLRKILQPIFKPEFLNKTKTLRPFLLNNWIKDPKLQEIFQLLPKGVLCESGLMSQKQLSSIISSKKLPPRQFYKLWSILNLEIWMRHYVNSPTGTSKKELPTKEFLLS